MDNPTRGDLACSVVIPTYNAEETIADQLNALRRQTFDRPFEVVIADNGSTDASAALARTFRHALDQAHVTLRVVDASRARGVSAARNDGIRAAATDVILICDADDVVSDGWVGAMVGALADHAFVGGPLETPTLSGPSASWVPFPTYTPDLFSEPWEGRRYAFGGNCGMRREVFDAVGGFDESYPAGGEEIDFAWRAGDAGFVPEFVPEALIHYRIRPTVAGVIRQQYAAGQGVSWLYSRVRPEGLAIRTPLQRLKREVRLLGTFPVRGGLSKKIPWLAYQAFEVGKVVGARRAGCPTP